MSEAPSLKNFHMRVFAYVMLVAVLAVTGYVLYADKQVPEGFYALAGAVILGWMGVSKWGENVATTAFSSK